MIQQRDYLNFFSRDAGFEPLWDNGYSVPRFRGFIRRSHENCGAIPPVSNGGILSNSFQVGLPTVHAMDLQIVLNKKGVFE